MTPSGGPTSTPSAVIAGNLRTLASNASWVLGLVWRTNRPLTGTLVGLALLQSMLPAAQALATRGLIDAAVSQLARGGGQLWPLAPWLLLAFVATIVEGIAGFGRNFAQRRLQDELDLGTTTSILEHASRLDVGFFEVPASEDVLARAKANTAANLVGFVGHALNTTTGLIQIASLFAIVVVIEPLVLVALVPFAVPYMRFRWRLSRTQYELERSRATKRRWTQYFVSLLTDAVTVPEVKVLELGPLLIRKFRSLMVEFRDQDQRLLKRSLRAASLFSSFATLALYGLFARVALRVLAGAATMGDLAIFGVATARLRMLLENEITAVAGVLQDMLHVADLRTFLGTEPSMAVSSRAIDSPVRGELELENVSFTYPGSAEPALRNLSLRIPAGETIAIVGENGSGKTTLVKLIARLYDPTSGTVTLDGRDLREIDPSDLRGEVGFVFQNFARYEGTVADNVAYGDWRHLLDDADGIARAGERAGLDDLVGKLPDRYDTIVGRRFGHFDLSSGQWQRVAMARALARDATILILDEPTASLDPRAETELFLRFRNVARGRTTILVSHRFSTVRMADRIVVMERGRIVEEGSHDELLRQAGTYAGLYGRVTGAAPP